MARKRSQSPRRDWRMWIFLALSLLLVLTMLLAYFPSAN
jgi:hypothetical protein